MLEDVYLFGSETPFQSMLKKKFNEKEVELLSITISDITFDKKNREFMDIEPSNDFDDLRRLKTLYGKKVFNQHVKVRIEIKDLNKDKYQNIFQYYHNEPVLEPISKIIREKKLSEKKDYSLTISNLIVKINSRFVSKETLDLSYCNSHYKKFWIINQSKLNLVLPESIHAEYLVISSPYTILDQKLKLYAQDIKLKFYDIKQLPELDFKLLQQLVVVQNVEFNQITNYINKIPDLFDVQLGSAQLKIKKLI
ncbi:MAG: hypothetical protein EBS55_14260 [Flavobacteriaceae bacterium]|nr:hypothetical protein [Flavobacteriaceae bacterium]